MVWTFRCIVPAGNEYPAMVEFAPFQKVPRRGGSKKKDARCGTIDQDPDYLAFLESIEKPENISLQPLEAVLEEIQAHDRELKGVWFKFVCRICWKFLILYNSKKTIPYIKGCGG